MRLRSTSADLGPNPAKSPKLQLDQAAQHDLEGPTYPAFQRLAHLRGVPGLWLCPAAAPGWLRPAAGAPTHLDPASVAPWTHHPLGPRGLPGLHLARAS